MSEQYSILIVDDEKSNRDILKHILRSSYHVQTAVSGKEGLEMARENKPDLILLDIVMPDLNGFDVILELKESDLTRHIPVIFITGLNLVEDEERGLFLGAVDYITKPFNHSIVQARIRTQLNIVKQIRTIERLGLIDALTDLPNRRSFNARVEIEWGRAIREKTPLSLLVIDVDQFKAYNDTYGHPQGDVLLQAIARIFASALKRPTDMAARLGGEEFVVLLPNTDIQGAMGMAETIRAQVEAARVPSLRTEQLFTSVTISVGVASARPTITDSLSNFIEQADKAMYQAKAMCRNKVCHFAA